MIKKYIGTGLIALGLTISVGFAAPAQAATLTSAQVSAIISLLQSFGADAGTVANVQATLGGSSTNSLSCASFGDLAYGNFDTTPGGRVSQLQTWLGISSSSFGFGTYGPKTRTLWNSKCGGTTPTTTIPPAISATVNSAAFSTSRPTITGTASGLIGVRLSLNIGSRVQYPSSWIAVADNGTWSHQVSDTIPPGAYRAVLTTADPKRSEGAVVAEGQINITGNDVAQCSTYESKPVITSITPSSGPVGTMIEIQGCNFLGFESDKVLWFTDSQGKKGILNGNMDVATRASNTVMRVSLPRTMCQNMNWYSGLDCSSFLTLIPGAYTIHTRSYGGDSNAVNFTVTAQ